ncbi:hypothetical protein [Moraxella catarrhalis]|uniref:Uncharacterized protein n=1 Tax=Moraxella catarrhalis TaxID=480 RepID=A0A198UMQ4_MORCA|nr:hypothetical protein [Moraxella catarrhalis]OAU97569.1 hypothetical protein AO384_0605 [Moraxella catarrhalis]OAU98811.1 hypothetical protein AO383_0377 [Moraxella catarrhalis]OAV02901.1 hypothetical protein AO385_0746 [Moraxella catarrhalis]
MKYLSIIASFLIILPSLAVAQSAYSSQTKQNLYTSSIPINPDDVINSIIQSSQQTIPTYQINPGWSYTLIENDFDDNVFRTARALSKDLNAMLIVSYNDKDKSYQNPIVGVQLSSDIDGRVWHTFHCMQTCPTIDMNVDGKKYQNMGTEDAGYLMLAFKNPKTVLNRIKNGETIKIRINQYRNELYYEFNIADQFSIDQLKQQ